MNLESELQCQIIPVKAGNLLIPTNLVAEVVILEDTDNQEELIWRNRKVPILKNNHSSKMITRVAILKTVMHHDHMPFIAIATDGIPHSLMVNPALLSERTVEDKRECSIAARYVTVGSLDCVIPDLPKIERMILENSNALGIAC